MKNDNMIEDLFADFHPELSDNDFFMTSLNRKLDAVEHIRMMQEAQRRHYRLAMVVAIGLGVVACFALFAVINALPEGVQLFRFDSGLAPLRLLERNSRMVSLIAVALLMGWGIIAISNAVRNGAGNQDPVHCQP